MVSIYSPRRPHALAKSELFVNRFIAAYYRALGAFPIERGKADRKVIRYAIELLKNEEPLLIFPEGTRSRTGEFAEAEIGLGMIAHAAKAPIIPVYIRGTQNALSSVRPGVRFTRSEIHYGEPLLFEEEYSRRGDRETLEAIGNRVMQEIIAMKERAEKERPY
jgi:1-acyl-sn-glycerol-3-phosphate acyltransferase